MTTRAKDPGSYVKPLAVVLFLFGLFAFVGSLFMWGQGFILTFPTEEGYHFAVADILVNAPASILTAIGLWRRRQWGYVAAQFVAGFYIYASVEIFTMVVEQGVPYPLEIIVPQVAAVIVAGLLVGYLWSIREQFN